MPSYSVYLEDENGKLHPFDTEPIRAASREDAMKTAIGGSPELFCLLMGYQKK